MKLDTPESLVYVRPPRSRGTLGDTPSARRPPSPPPYRAGTGREPSGTAPAWLADKIENNRRAARPEPCRHCAANTLVGPDHDRCADTARVDPTPVDHLNEVVGILQGRATYYLIRGELNIRFTEGRHAHRYPVHLAHRCTPTDPEVLF